jgi:hypothetical protein
MLTVVQHDEELSVAEVLSEGLDDPADRRVVQAERPRHLLGEQGGITQAPELDPPGPVREAAGDLLGGSQSKPRLPHTRGAR